ncbi:TMEM175 family protein [Streptomyces sp. NPDC001606]
MTTDPGVSGRRSAADFSTARLEAFSDGVFPIAITLLVLDLRVPEPDALHGEPPAHALARQGPASFAYLVSFLVIGII